MRRVTGAFIAGAVGLATFVGLAAPASAVTGTQRFIVVVRSGPGQESCTIIATGPITGAGTCVVEDVSEEETVVHATIGGSAFDVTATTQSATSDFNEQACVFRFTLTETFVVKGVSGAFANASGSGTDVVTGTFVAPKTASGCSDEAASGVIVGRGTGTVTL